MLVKIKPHSSLRQYFKADEFSADINYYADIHEYLRSMHPKFSQYLRRLYSEGLNESFVFLDKNLKEITPDSLFLRKAKEDDIIHIVPAIVGGGGKRGGILAALALIAFVYFLPVLAPAMGTLGTTAVSAATATGTAAGAAAGAGVGSFAGGAAILAQSSMLTNIVVNVGLAIITSLFMPEPEAGEETRQNDMFGSLTNSTRVGTPVALHYGLTRVAGQLVSGHIRSTDHGKTDEINVADVMYNAATLESTQSKSNLPTFLQNKTGAVSEDFNIGSKSEGSPA